MLNNSFSTQSFSHNSFFRRANLLAKALFYGADWGWNPTHTTSAITAAECFINQKNTFPNIESKLAKDPEASKIFTSVEFVEDMSKSWNLDELLQKYPVGTLGNEYVLFMKNLGFEPLTMNFSTNIPVTIRNIIGLGIRNHDIIHLLLGLYEVKRDKNNNTKYNITDYHEWVFLRWTEGQVHDKSEKLIISFLLFPSMVKAFCSFRLSEYKQAMAQGQLLASSSKDLNLMWLKPYFNLPIAEVKQLLVY